MMVQKLRMNNPVSSCLKYDESDDTPPRPHSPNNKVFNTSVQSLWHVLSLHRDIIWPEIIILENVAFVYLFPVVFGVCPILNLTLNNTGTSIINA
mmetsp:Transcript_40051/g.65585  ORF Transcript_40051/g.65585 Transcript_40051/m.65585 type:complete len:95 (+) Transcript_40051:90-374(+)